MTIFDRLRQDHQTQRQLLAQLAETSGDSAERRDLFSELAEELERHAIAEEHVLYSRMMAGSGRAKAVHSVAEHKDIRDRVEELSEMEMGSPAWLPKLRTLRKIVEHHLDEEETETFEMARVQLTSTEIQELAVAFRRRSHAAEEEIAAS